MGKIIAFANQKGGVGKTTSAVNVAAALGLLGKRVLLVDCDPQGNTTSGVGISKKAPAAFTYDVMIGRVHAEDAIVATEFKNLDVMPSNMALAGAEFELVDAENREQRLRDALAPLRDFYDYMIVDCPPSLGILTINTLVAADGVVIPMQCEYYSLEGLSQLLITIRNIKHRWNPELEITGILLTMYNGRLNLTTQVVAELKRYYAGKLFRTPIQRSVRLTEAPGFGKPIVYFDRWSKGGLAYMDVAEELTERI